jgi:DNA-binding MarR family transcriptional regulator
VVRLGKRALQQARAAGAGLLAVTAGQTTYDLRRLKARGLIARVPHSHRYTVTDHGLHTARFLTCVHDRFLPTGLAHLANHVPIDRGRGE